jgi:hypothetical protein
VWIYEGEVCGFMRRQCVNLRGGSVRIYEGSSVWCYEGGSVCL